VAAKTRPGTAKARDSGGLMVYWKSASIDGKQKLSND